MKVDKWAGNETVSINDILAFLNEINKLDPKFMKQLTTTRFPCSTELRDHETAQAHCYGEYSMDKPAMGLLGVLNGALGIDRNHFGPVAAALDDSGTLLGFKLTDTEKITEGLVKKEEEEKKK